jgi:hypothetical protein
MEQGYGVGFSAVGYPDLGQRNGRLTGSGFQETSQLGLVPCRGEGLGDGFCTKVVASLDHGSRDG